VSKGTPAPKKTRDVKLNFPEPPAGTVVGGMWLGEVLLDSSGKVRRVWPLREAQLTPPFPPFNEAIVATIRQWEYEPVVVDSEASPACMTVVVNVHLR
jgi:hypothetical protein